jgi:hypothetical protein
MRQPSPQLKEKVMEGDCWAIYGQTLNAIKVELARQHAWVVISACEQSGELIFLYIYVEE